MDSLPIAQLCLSLTVIMLHGIKINDLQNKTFINNKLKLVSSEQLLLGAFHHFRTDEGKTFLQCPNELEFTMDGKTIKCGILQKIPLQDNFKIEYGGSVLTAQHLQNTASKFKTWMSRPSTGLKRLHHQLSSTLLWMKSSLLLLADSEKEQLWAYR